MSYTKTVWRNNQAPAINADNLNHIEQGIESAHNQMAINTSDIETLTTQVQGNASNIASEISARQTADSSLQSQIDQIIAPSGEAPSAAEVENARIAASIMGGETYDTLGNAIRGQVTDLKSALNDIVIWSSNRLNLNTITPNKYIAPDGTESASTANSVTDFIPVTAGETIYFWDKRQDGYYLFDARFLTAYDSSKVAVSASGGSYVGGSYTVPSGISFVRLTISNTYLSSYTDFYVGTLTLDEYSQYLPYGAVKSLINQPQVDGNTVDISTNTANITKNTNDLASITESTSNLLNLDAITANKYINKSGAIESATSLSVTDYLPVEEGDIIYGWGTNNGTVTAITYRFVCAYDSDKNAVSASGNDSETTADYTVPSGIAYLRITLKNEVLSSYTNLYIGTHEVGVDYEPFGIKLKIEEQVNTNTEDIDNITEQSSNLLDLNAITSGTYITVDGSIEVAQTLSATDYLPVEEGDIIYGWGKVNGEYNSITYRMLCAYDSNKIAVPASGESVESSGEYTVPQGIKYVRITIRNEVLAYENLYIGTHRVGYKYEPYGKIVKINYEDADAVYSISNGGSILQAVKHCYSEGIKHLVVEAGVYDIIQEYKDFYGNSYFDNYIDYYQGDLFDAGIWLHDIDVKFSAGAKVVCKYTGNNQNVIDYFSAFATGNNVTLDGLVLDAENLRYGIHADYNTGTDETYFIVKNCDLKHVRTDGNKLIGAGLGKHVYWLFENTIFRTTGNYYAIRIHNNVSADAQSKVVVKDCYIDGDGYFKFEPYSTSTYITIVQVSGCSYKTVPLIERTTPDSNDNVTMIAWNNELRS